MSTLKMQESTPDNEVTQLRRQATNKDIHYATLENELLKRNNDLLLAKGTLDDALYKLRKEADRALKLEEDLNRRSEDLRAERLTRQNIETSLDSANEKLRSEELAVKHLEMELETYASRTSSQHQGELKQLQREKMMLETRVRTLETQSQASKPSQLPTRLPRPMTFSGEASSQSDTRITTLESELSKAQRELADMSQVLSNAQQEAAKLPHLQSKLIAAENAQLRAERLASTDKIRADSVQETLREREEEVEYWRSTFEDKSVIEAKLEELTRERDDAVTRENEIRWCEAATRKRLEEMEEKEVQIVTEREEALDALHQLQARSNLTSSVKEAEDGFTEEDLRAALAEREAALLNARGYATELHQLYRDTLDACKAAEARARDLEPQSTNHKDPEPPLIIVSPPTSASPAEPFLANIQPATNVSPEDEAAVARLLIAIERLRSERNALRHDLDFMQTEADALRLQLAAAESQAHPAVMDVQTRQDDVCVDNDTEIQRLNDELRHRRCEASEMEDALVIRTRDLDACNTELESVRGRVQALDDSTGRTAAHMKNARLALSSLIIVEHLRSNLDEVEMSNEALSQKCDNLTEIRNHLVGAREKAEATLLEVVQSRDASFSAQESLRKELVANDVHLSEVLQTAQDRDSQIANMHAQLSELQTAHSTLERDLAEAHQELHAAEIRYSQHQLSALASADVGAASALKAQLEVLEQRVLRRTEQIGMQQHDIKRLETNLRVAEDTISELNIEVETLGQEKECLVEDCAQAREARDEAHRRIEALEVEVETLTKEHEDLAELKNVLRDAEAEVAASEGRIEVLVHVIADSAARSRASSVELASTAARLSTIEIAFHTAEASHSQVRAEVERLTLELESKAQIVEAKSTDIESLTRELCLAKEESRHLSSTFESFKQDVHSRKQDTSGQTRHLVATVQDLEIRLADAQASEEALSKELESAKDVQLTLTSQVLQAQEGLRVAEAEAEDLSSTIASLENAVEAGRLSHSRDLERATHESEDRLMELEAQLEERRIQHVSLQTNHAQVVQDFIARNEDLQARLAEIHADATRRESLEGDLRRLKDVHAEEVLAFRSRLDESAGQIEVLQGQLNTAAEAIQEFELHMETSAERYEAAQVEIRGLEHVLTGTRAQLDEHDTSIQALQREKTLLQGEHTRLEAELEKSVTKYQYLEQHARRSDHDIMRLKAEVDHLRTEAAKFDEAAQKAEVSLSFKTVQFEQKLAMMERELKKQQEHRQCQESVSELKEKNEYLEEMLRMKSVEIEENDDRFIEALKEKKRLNGKIESMTRKVQSLQTKLAAVTAQPSPTTPAALPTSRPKTPSPPVPPSIPFAGPSVRPPTRIPSSPAAALRAKTPEPSRSQFASKLATEPPVPALPQTFKIKSPEFQIASHSAPRVEQLRVTDAQPSGSRIPSPDVPSTPLSSGSRKRRAPDDFDSPAPIATQVVVAPSLNLTQRHLRRPTNEGRSGFTPTRNGIAAPAQPALTQPSPLRRVTAPLSETTNSPRGSRAPGLGKPAAAAKQPMRSWLSRSRPPTGGSMDMRSSSVLDTRP